MTQFISSKFFLESFLFVTIANKNDDPFSMLCQKIVLTI